MFQDLVIAIADRDPSVRHELFIEGLEEAEHQGKKVLLLAEKGSLIYARPNVIMVTIDHSNPVKSLREAIAKFRDLAGDDEDLLRALTKLLLEMLVAVSIAILVGVIIDWLLGSAREQR